MQLYLGLAAVAVTIAAVLIGGTSLGSAQEPCPRGQTPSTTDPCTPQPDTTVSGRPGTTVSFTPRVPSEECSASGSWCHVAENVRWSSCRGPFTLVWDPAEDDPDAPEVTQGTNRYGLTGVEARGTRMAVDLLDHDRPPLHLTYVYVGQRTLEFRGTPDSDGTADVSRETVACSLGGVVRINVTPKSGTIYGHTVPADVDRSGGNVWVVVTPAEGGVGYTDPQHPDNQVGTGNGSLVRVSDLPICPTLPPRERPDHQCRARG